MSLRNKFAILSVILISLMTIQAYAENDAPVSLRIENDEYLLEVAAPEGWQPIKESAEISETFEFEGSKFHTLKFSNGTVNHGCVVLFTSDADEINEYDEDEGFIASLNTLANDIHQLIYGSSPSYLQVSSFEISAEITADGAKQKVHGNWSGYAERVVNKEIPKTIADEGQTEPTVTKESIDSPITANGAFDIDSENQLVIATGNFVYENATYRGATGLLINDDYEIIISAWGADEATLKNDIVAFFKAFQVTKKPRAIAVASDSAETAPANANTIATPEAPVVAVTLTETQA